MLNDINKEMSFQRNCCDASAGKSEKISSLLLNELDIDKDEINHWSKIGKTDFCNFYGKVGFYGQP